MTNKQGTEKCECEAMFNNTIVDRAFCPIHSPQGDTPEWESQFDKEFTGDTGYTDFPVFAIKDFIRELLLNTHKDGYRLGEKNGMKAISNETKMRIEKAVAQERQEIVKMVRGMQSVCEETMQGGELQTIVRTCSAVIENIIQRGTKSAEK